jgi:hypothetical protein
VDGYRDAKRGDGFVLDRGSSHPFEPTAAASGTPAATAAPGTPGTPAAAGTWHALAGRQRHIRRH